MYRRILLFLLVILSVTITSCNNGAGYRNRIEDGSDNINSTNGPHGASEQAGRFTDDDMVLNLNGRIFRFGEDASGLLEFLGEPEEVTEILSCYYDGYDKTYEYKNMEVITFPRDGKEILQEVIFHDDTYSFKGGVKVGSTKEEVIASYGEGFFMEDNAMIYNRTGDSKDTDSPRLTFILENNRVKSVDFFSSSYFS